MGLSREQAWSQLCEWTPSDSLRRHARAVEAEGEEHVVAPEPLEGGRELGLGERERVAQVQAAVHVGVPGDGCQMQLHQIRLVIHKRLLHFIYRTDGIPHSPVSSPIFAIKYSMENV